MFPFVGADIIRPQVMTRYFIIKTNHLSGTSLLLSVGAFIGPPTVRNRIAFKYLYTLLFIALKHFDKT
jgi:hypothetical protein